MAREIGRDDPGCTIKIADAREIAERFDLQGIVITAIRRDGTVESITYGDHPAQKVAMGQIADMMLERTLGRMPFTTMFGYDNSGVPKRLSEVEIEILIQKGWTRAEIDRFTHPDAE